ncbi:MAG TPA: heme-binding protein [Candidatus Acidoferrales bacterium]|jgi:uncharacterized protein GlcG (DUF336 family)|nr:heme-binding protein [Candidatus Acidoferrales bacterium]
MAQPATEPLTLELAEEIIAAAKKKAEDLGVKEDIAVVDAGGNLKAFARMDGAWLGSIDIAMRKARTARYFDMETAKIGKMSQPGEPLYGIEFSNGGLISFGGGIPLKDREGIVIGAIGASGTTVDKDVEIAEAGAEVCKKARTLSTTAR